MFKDNLIELRKINNMSQEDLASQIGVSRQTLSKYETGESLPDIDKCSAIAKVFGITVDDLINYDKEENMGVGVPPKGKYMFGMVKVGDKGQIVIPKQAREIFGIKPGDTLFLFGDEKRGIVIPPKEEFSELFGKVFLEKDGDNK